MKTKMKGLLTLMGALACSAIGLTACDEAPDVYQAINDQQHKLGETTADHNFGEQQDVVAATCESNGSYTQTCSDCNYKKTVVVPATGHTWTNATTDATCDTAGSVTSTCTCGATKSEAIAPKGHTWTNVSFAWNFENGTVTLNGTCACGDSLTDVATVSVERQVQSSCAEAGATIYTATAYVNGEVLVIDGEAVTDVQVITGDKTSHFVTTYSKDDFQHWFEKTADCACSDVAVNKENHNIVYSYDVENAKTITTCSDCGWSKTADGITNSAFVKENNTFALTSPVYNSGDNTWTNDDILVRTFTAEKMGHYVFSIPANSSVVVKFYETYDEEDGMGILLGQADTMNSIYTNSARLILAEGKTVYVVAQLRTVNELDLDNPPVYNNDYYTFDLNYVYEQRGFAGSDADFPITASAGAIEKEVILQAGESVFYALETSTSIPYYYAKLNVAGGDAKVFIGEQELTLTEGSTSPIRFTSEAATVVEIKNVGVEAASFEIDTTAFVNPEYILEVGENTVTVPVADMMAGGVQLYYENVPGELYAFTFATEADQNADAAKAQKVAIVNGGEQYLFGYNVPEEGEPTFAASHNSMYGGDYGDTNLILVGYGTYETETIDVKITVGSLLPGVQQNPMSVNVTKRGETGYNFVGYESGEITLAAGASYYYTVNCNTSVYSGLVKVSLTGNVDLSIGGDAQTLTDGAYIYEVADSSAYVITNNTDGEVTFTMSIDSYRDDKEALAVQTNVVTLSETQAADGYEVVFIANKAGKYTFTSNYGLGLIMEGVVIHYGSFTMDMTENSAIAFTVFAEQAGAYEFDISFTSIDKGNKDFLIIGVNEIVLGASDVNGYDSEFIAPKKGIYTFSIANTADATIMKKTPTGSEEILSGGEEEAGADKTFEVELEAGQSFGLIFSPAGWDPSSYDFKISCVPAVGDKDTLVVGKNVIELDADQAYNGYEATFTAEELGKYIFSFANTADAALAILGEYGFELLDMSEDGDNYTYSVVLQPEESFTFLLCAASFTPAPLTTYDLYITKSEVGTTAGLIVGTNFINANNVGIGVAATFTAPATGDYKLTISATADALVFVKPDGMGGGECVLGNVEDVYTYTLSLTEDAELPLLFMPAGWDPSTYNFEIECVREYTINPTTLVVGENYIVKDSYFEHAATFKPDATGDYLVTVTGEAGWVMTSDYMSEAGNGQSFTITVEDLEAGVTLLLSIEMSFEEAQPYTVTITPVE